MRELEVVRQELSKSFKGFGMEKLGKCFRLIVELDDGNVFNIYIFKGKEVTFYFKVLDLISECEQALFNPYGLFGYANSEVELANKIWEKVKVIWQRKLSMTQ